MITSKIKISIQTVCLLAIMLSGIHSIAKAQQQVQLVSVSGYNEVPQTLSAGTGAFTLTLSHDTLKVSGSFSNLSDSFLSAGIHDGKKNKKGDIVFPLSVQIKSHHTSGTLKPKNNTFVLDAKQKKKLKNGLFYIDICTSKNPNGELRGQIPAF